MFYLCLCLYDVFFFMFNLTIVNMIKSFYNLKYKTNKNYILFFFSFCSISSKQCTLITNIMIHG